MDESEIGLTAGTSMEEVSDKSNFPLGHSAFLLTSKRCRTRALARPRATARGVTGWEGTAEGRRQATRRRQPSLLADTAPETPVSTPFPTNGVPLHPPQHLIIHSRFPGGQDAGSEWKRATKLPVSSRTIACTNVADGLQPPTRVRTTMGTSKGPMPT